MKKIFLLLIAFVWLGAFGQNPYPEKTGKIGYKFNMGTMKIDYVITYDDFGNKQAIDAKSVINGETSNSTTIITREGIFIVNHNDKQVIKMPADMGDDSDMMNDDEDSEFDISEFAKRVNEYKESKQGTGTVMGKECDIYSITEEGMKGKYWIWKNYLLKAEFTSEGVATTIEATDLKVNIDVPSSAFIPPSGYSVTDMGQMMEQMQNMQQYMNQMPDEE